jgi:hypothetical protein
MRRRDDRSGESRAEARRDWLERELGDDWVAQGDGTYRFVGSSRDAPIARDDAHPQDEEVARPDASDEPISRQPRRPRLPWHRH